MKINKPLHLVIGFVVGLATLSSSYAVDDLSISEEPLFLASVPPNIMVMLDNSGSMKLQLYEKAVTYNNATDYYGIFDYDKNYEYDSSIPVNAAGYQVHASIDIDTTKTGAFVESTCTPAEGNATCWSGRFLNWFSTKRIDASRRVLVGGKLESNTAYTYGTDLNYKIIANNEKDDEQFTESASDSASYSPVPNDQRITVSSPAQDNNGTIQAAYDPYAKIYTGASFVYNSADQVIGEFGSVTTKRDESWKTVPFTHTYATAPIVVAKPPTYGDDYPGVVRIRSVTTTSFQIRFREWQYLDSVHEAETVKFIALTEGMHTLPGGMYAQAGKAADVNDVYNSNDCGHGKTDSTSVTFPNSMNNVSFSGDPVVIASVSTNGSGAAVSLRVWEVSDAGFKTAMQEEEAGDNNHANEDISWIAFNQGTVDDTTNYPNWKLESKLISGVSEEDKVVTFDTTTFATPPSVLAGIQTMAEDDAAALRIKSSSKTGFTTFVEEELGRTCDSEVDHSDEKIGYVALEGARSEYNVALVVEDKPTGLLHDIKDQVRLGISFYRYDPNAANIYGRGTLRNKINGGTLQFKIPKNPFVQKPTDTDLPADEQGYRDPPLTGYIGTGNIDTIVDAINNYPLVWGTTPLAENLWEVIQYFEQDDPHYDPVVTGFPDFETAADAGDNELDPYYYPEHGKKLQCAKSSVIIFTDGEPFRDADVPPETLDYDGDSHSKDVVDNVDPDTQGKDNLDDVAYWAYCDKSKTDECSTDAGGTRDLRGDGDIDNDEDIDGRAITQHLKIYTVGFADGAVKQVLQDAADNAGGKAYAAEDGTTLKAALTDAFTAAISDSSASSVAVTTGSITSTSAVFQALFNSIRWTGELLAYPINSDGSLGSEQNAAIIPGESSDTAAILRKIITYNGTKGVPFQWPAIPATPTANEISLAQVTSLVSEDVLDYLRGDQSNEEINGGTFRDRDSLLGDIVNSSPTYVSSSSVFSYPDSLESGSHSTWKSTLSRSPVVYVGSNDGMLHTFDATITEDVDGNPVFSAGFGNEIFAYVPGFVYDKLDDLTSVDYNHKYIVDAPPIIGDAYFDNGWHTVLVAGVNAGGQGIYALDITSTTVASESAGSAKVLWEFTDADDDGDHTDGNVGEKGDLDLGYTYSKPNIVRMANGKWAAVFGNGYNNTTLDGNVSTTGNAVLYIVDLETGGLIKKIDTGVGYSVSYSGGKPNGLSTVAPVDVNGDHKVDYIYGGDLYGNLWKFNVKSTDIDDWVVSFSGAPLFQACAADLCDDDNRQPITVRPQVGYKTKDVGYMVYFGTGKYIETTDDSATDQTTQSFYGIWDKDESILTSFGRSNLLQQSILLELTAFEYDLRVTTNSTMSSGHLGWYMDLINTEDSNTDNFGERQVSDPVLRNGRIIFTTLIPSSDPCGYGGTSWLMELDAQLGGRLPYTPFDLDGDGYYDSNDYVEVVLDGETVKIPVSGKKSGVGIINTPGIVSDDEKEYKYTSGSTGQYEVTSENPGLQYTGRQSWNRLDQ